MSTKELTDMEISGGLARIRKAAKVSRDTPSAHFRFQNVIYKGKTELIENNVLVLIASKVYFMLPQQKLLNPKFHLFDLKRVHQQKHEVTFTTTAETIGPILIDDAVQRKNLFAAMNKSLEPAKLSLPRLCKCSNDVIAASPKISDRVDHFDRYLCAYQAACAYHEVPVRQFGVREIIECHKRNGKVQFHGDDFGCLDTADSLGLVTALHWSDHYTEFVLEEARVKQNLLDSISLLAMRTSCLQKIVLVDIGAKSEFWTSFGDALKNNEACKLNEINVSKNASIEDKGAIYLHVAFRSLKLKRLEMAEISMTSKGLSAICTSLKGSAETLEHIDFHGNKLGGDGAKAIVALFNPGNIIRHLNIEDTGSIIADVIKALTLLSVESLTTFKISKNKFCLSKQNFKGDQVLSRFTASAVNLCEMDLSDSSIPQEALSLIIDGLSKTYVASFKLDIARCELGPPAATLICGSVSLIQSLKVLDLSGNSFEDGDLGRIFKTLATNSTVSELYLNDSQGHLKADSRRKTVMIDPSTKLTSGQLMVEGCCEMLKSETSVLKVLSLRDCKLKTNIVPILYALGENTSLKTIDIAGNFCSDGGAGALASAIFANRTLENIKWDNNLVTTFGLREVMAAVKTNDVLVSMPLPFMDIMTMMKVSAEHTLELVNNYQVLFSKRAVERSAASNVRPESEMVESSVTSPQPLSRPKPEPRKPLVPKGAFNIFGDLGKDSNDDSIQEEAPTSFDVSAEPSPATSPNKPIQHPTKERAKPMPGRRLPTRKPGSRPGSSTSLTHQSTTDASPPKAALRPKPTVREPPAGHRARAGFDPKQIAVAMKKDSPIKATPSRPPPPSAAEKPKVATEAEGIKESPQKSGRLPPGRPAPLMEMKGMTESSSNDEPGTPYFTPKTQAPPVMLKPKSVPSSASASPSQERKEVPLKSPQVESHNASPSQQEVPTKEDKITNSTLKPEVNPPDELPANSENEHETKKEMKVANDQNTTTSADVAEGERNTTKETSENVATAKLATATVDPVLVKSEPEGAGKASEEPEATNNDTDSRKTPADEGDNGADDDNIDGFDDDGDGFDDDEDVDDDMADLADMLGEDGVAEEEAAMAEVKVDVENDDEDMDDLAGLLGNDGDDGDNDDNDDNDEDAGEMEETKEETLQDKPEVAEAATVPPKMPKPISPAEKSVPPVAAKKPPPTVSPTKPAPIAPAVAKKPPPVVAKPAPPVATKKPPPTTAKKLASAPAPAPKPKPGPPLTKPKSFRNKVVTPPEEDEEVDGFGSDNDDFAI